MAEERHGGPASLPAEINSTRVDHSAMIARERDVESQCRCAETEFAVTVHVQQFSDEYAAAVVQLVHGSLRDEFGQPISYREKTA